jgi:hypothetical protein
VAIGIVMLAALTACVSNSRLQQFELVAHDIGTPRLSDFSEAGASVAGWSLHRADSYPWVRQFFGDKAAWIRYAYSPQSTTPPAAFRAGAPVVMDVISTSDRAAFSTFGLEACYGFHRYQLLDAHRVLLAGGVVGHQLAYRNRADRSTWMVVYWEWPVAAGGQERYERVVLSFKEDEPVWQPPPLPSNRINAAELAISDWLSGSRQIPASPRLREARDFLVGFAQQVITSAVAHQSHAPDGLDEGSA